jgi:hypothetical protein
MLILVMRITQAKAFMLDLAVSPASKRQKSRITTYVQGGQPNWNEF